MKQIIFLTVFLTLVGCAAVPSKTPEKSQSKNTTETEDQDLAATLTALFGQSITPDPQEIEKYPLGSAENPVRASGPSGQRRYLSRLICDNGEVVSAFSREGSAGIGPYGSIMDAYVVICDTNKGAINHTLYMDMYHSNYEETRPAQGFKALK